MWVGVSFPRGNDGDGEPQTYGHGDQAGTEATQAQPADEQAFRELSFLLLFIENSAACPLRSIRLCALVLLRTRLRRLGLLFFVDILLLLLLLLLGRRPRTLLVVPAAVSELFR